MKQRYHWEVLYQEIDSDRCMRLFTLENHILTVAGKAADEGGFGIQYLYPLGLTWIITNCSIEMQKIPIAGDKLIFETWIESNAHMLSIRNFRIYKKQETKNETQEDTLIGRAKTTWAVFDLYKREIVNVFDHSVFQNIVDGEVLNMPKASRMIPTIPATQLPYSSIPITYSMIDYNNHLNSCKYPEIMLDVYKPEWLNKPFRFDIRYIKEMKQGQTITTLYQNVDNRISYQQKDDTGATVCTAQIYQL